MTKGYIEALEDYDTKMQQIYTQRNNCAIALAKMTIAAGGKAGRGIDPAQPDERWAHVVYIDLPNGEQVSYHIGPSEVPLLDGLPIYPDAWDGKFNGRSPDWAGFDTEAK